MTAAEPLFDTHAHILSPDARKYPPSAEGAASNVAPYAVEQLRADMAASAVTHACLVQRFHYYRNDNAYVLDSAEPKRLGAVIMLDGLDPEAPQKLHAIDARQRLAGLRFAAAHHAHYDTAWMNSPSAMRLWEAAAKLSLPVAIIFYLRHIPYNVPALAMIAEAFPELPIVVDHIGVPHAPMRYLPLVGEGRPSPPVGPPDYGVTAALMALRAHRNVHYKFTGINLEVLAANGVDAAAFLRHCVSVFGPERMMCGTDIGQTDGPYARIVAELRAAMALLSDEERRAVLFDTASRVYGPRFA